jgi:YVTN family beta-propeller protein
LLEREYSVLVKYVAITTFISLFFIISLVQFQINAQLSDNLPFSTESIDIGVGDRPRGLGFNGNTNLLYVSNYGSNSISVINVSSQKVTAEVKTEFSPNNVFVNPTLNKIYVVYSDSDFIDIIDGFINKLSSRIYPITKANQSSHSDKLNLGSLGDLAVNPIANKIYAIYNSSILAVINGITNDIISLQNKSNLSIGPVAINPNTGKIYLYDHAHHSISVFDEKTFINDANISLGDIPDEIIVDTSKNKVYGTIGEGNRIFVIDGNSNKFSTTIISGYSRDPGYNDLVIDSTNNRIYVSNPNTQSIAVIDPFKGMINELQLSGDPAKMEINLRSHQIYVLREELDTVSIIDVPLATEVPAKLQTPGIDVGDDPLGIAVNQNENIIYVANYKSLTVSIIDGSNNKVLKELALGKSSLISDILFNPTDNKAYLGFSNGTVAVIDESFNARLLPLNLGDLSSLGFNPAYPNLLYLFHNYFSGKITVFDVHKNKIVYNMSSTYLREEGGELTMGEETVFPIIGEDFYKTQNEAGFYNVTYNIGDGYLYELALTSYDVRPIRSIPISNDPSLYDLHDVSLVDINLQTNTAYVTTPNNTLAVIDMYINKVIANVPVGKFPSAIAINPQTNLIYVTSQNNTLSVINGNNNTLIANVPVGKFPSAIAINPQTNLIYVANTGSDRISVIQGLSNKVLSDITFHVYPSKSGHIECENKEYPTNTYIRLPSGTECLAKPNEGFRFIQWTEELGSNASKRITASTGSNSLFDYILRPLGFETEENSQILNISEYGNFSANFKEIPPPIPAEYWASLFTVVATALIGSLLIPAIAGWFRSKKQISRLNSYHRYLTSLYDDAHLNEKDLKKLNTLHKTVSDEYSKGRINNDQYTNLKNEISVLYEEMFRNEIDTSKGSLDGDVNTRLNKLTEDVKVAYSKNKINNEHFISLKNEISIAYYTILKKRIESLGSVFETATEREATIGMIKEDISESYSKDQLIKLHYDLLNEKVSKTIKEDDGGNRTH